MLMLGGAKQVSRADLAAIATPRKTASWKPLRHKLVADTVIARAEKAGLQVRDEKWVVMNGALYPEPGTRVDVPSARLFGTVDFERVEGIDLPGRTERNVQQLARLDTEEFRKTVTFSPKENAGRPPKIRRELIPVIAEYLLTERVTSKAQIIRFLKERHGLSVSFEALDPVLKEYGLERLIQRAPYRKDVDEDTAPLFSGPRASRAPGS